MENFAAVFVAGIFAVIGIGLGIPLALQKVPRNYLYGYRINRYVMEDDDIWFAVNRVAGFHLVGAGIAFAVIVAISALFIGNPRVQMDILSGITILVMAGLALSMIATFRLSYRMAAEKGLR